MNSNARLSGYVKHRVAVNGGIRPSIPSISTSQ